MTSEIIVRLPDEISPSSQESHIKTLNMERPSSHNTHRSVGQPTRQPPSHQAPKPRRKRHPHTTHSRPHQPRNPHPLPPPIISHPTPQHSRTKLRCSETSLCDSCLP